MTKKQKQWTLFITLGIPLLSFLGVQQLPIPSLAYASDVEDIQQTLEAKIEVLKGNDEKLRLADLETQREQKQIYHEQYEQQLEEAEDESFSHQVKGTPEPLQIQRRIDRYQRFLRNNEKQILILDQKIIIQQQRADPMTQ